MPQNSESRSKDLLLFHFIIEIPWLWKGVVSATGVVVVIGAGVGVVM